MKIVLKIKNFVKSECKKPSSKYGYEPYEYHFEPMVKYADMLADKFGADKEIILIAAWLHDIGSIIEGRENHHKSGARIAEEKLTELGYPKNKIDLVKRCILNHRGSVDNERPSLEEQIIAEADTISCFDDIPGIFKAAFVYENLDQGKAKISIRKKFQNKWKKLHFNYSKKMLKPKYDAIMLLLKQTND